MIYVKSLRSEAEVNAYYSGAERALHAFAWWGDGVEFVGSGRTTLRQAQLKLREEREKKLVAVRRHGYARLGVGW